MKQKITADIAVAYTQCPRKAFLLLFGTITEPPHEYVQILLAKQRANQTHYLEKLAQEQPDVVIYQTQGLASKHQFLMDATLKTERFEAECGLLTKVASHSALGHYSYKPTLFVGTHSVSNEQKLALFFTGRVLEELQTKPPTGGRIIDVTGKAHSVNLSESAQALFPVLEPLNEWVTDASPAEPPVILNKHCPLCQFRDACRAKAEQENNLSLLDRMTPKIIRQYERKGIFTVTQLSYTFKPRKRKKRTKNPPPVTHKLELQALAIREGKIYLQELPELTRQPVELFLDIEGIPDQNVYYLFGLLVCEGESSTHHAFWADTLADEARIWQQFVDKANAYPDAPIYHYGNYEAKALKKLAQRYDTDGDQLLKRLVNVNGFIYGKVYFPIFSNRLKEIGQFIGATWSAPEASGVQSLVWRHYWEERRDARYREMLVTYNREDCQALKLVTIELYQINNSANMLSEVDFADQYKEQVSDVGQKIQSQFKEILKFAHFGYDKKKISFREDNKQNKSQDASERKAQTKNRHTPKQSVVRKRGRRRVVHISPMETCPQCGYRPLKITTIPTEKFIIDLVLTKNGLKKTFTQYSSIKGYCVKCSKSYSPNPIHQYGKNQIYGHGFGAWMVHQRIALRLPYESIVESAMEYFNERISIAMPMYSVQKFAKEYAETNRLIANKMLVSPFIHADETKVNISGANWYVWVFTNENHVIFKLRETREATVVHEFLANYKGILISDFYGGYDSVPCRQQKCWVHLIRDLNDDLKTKPFDKEFEQFVSEVRDLIIPIMEAIQKYGLKNRNLNRFRSQVRKFYQKVIVGKRYKSDLVAKYQKRFVRYENSLFTFLEEDGIPWHNNTAERAIRPFAIQRETSKVPLGKSVTHDYLALLSIRQTCRFQGKSFFKFLFSGETDLDKFQKSKRYG